MKASFWGLFKTNSYGHFHKLFLFAKFNLSRFQEKVFLTVLEFCASKYFSIIQSFYLGHKIHCCFSMNYYETGDIYTMVDS